MLHADELDAALPVLTCPVKPPPRPEHAALRREQAQLTRHRVLEAARRLFVARGDANGTMREVAQEAGVGVQTVYAIFGTKLGLAKGMIEAAAAEVDIPAHIRRADASQDPPDWLGTVAAIARRFHDRLADVYRFMREAGDPQLAAELDAYDRFRLEHQAPLGPALAQAVLPRDGISQEEASDLTWALSGPESYTLLVRRRGWSPDRWEHRTALVARPSHQLNTSSQSPLDGIPSIPTTSSGAGARDEGRSTPSCSARRDRHTWPPRPRGDRWRGSCECGRQA